MNEIEVTLVVKAQKGDKKAFEQIVLMYEKRVYVTAFRMCNNEQDALDITQEVFIRLFKSLPNFQSGSMLSTYIYKITSNMCIDFYRKNKSHNEVVSLYQTDSDGDDYELPVADKGETPHEALECSEKMELLKKGIEHLGDEHRKMIVLRDINGLSYKEISDITDIPEQTVKTKIFRAREKLRHYLLGSGNFSEYEKSNKLKKGESVR